jgi:hypothetical protein
MRILIVATALALGGCNVSTDSANNSMTVQYDQNKAENTAADIGNTAENIGQSIANDVDRTAAKIDNSSIVADDEDSNPADNKQ